MKNKSNLTTPSRFASHPFNTLKGNLFPILMVLFFLPVFVSAQISHEISINGGGGLSTLNYKLSTGKHNLGGGGEFGIGYTCVFTKMIGIHIGAEIALYNSNANLNGAKCITPNLIDSEGDRFNMHTTLNKYKETQNAIFLNIPVMAHFQIKICKTHKFYAMGGFKFGFPIGCKYKVSDATITNEGYYPDYYGWLKEPEFAGYGTFTNINSNGKLPLKASVALALEAGMKWNVGKLFAVYTGVYFDYGLNNIRKNTNFVNNTNSESVKFTTNSALPSVTNKLNLMTFGIKARFAFIK